MKETYESLYMDIVVFDADDVITLSTGDEQDYLGSEFDIG